VERMKHAAGFWPVIMTAVSLLVALMVAPLIG
jgi:hypothetical protein